MSLTNDDFAKSMTGIDTPHAIAIGVSGGPDSMALCKLLSHWAAPQNIIVHAITVDHGLRTESADEAKQIGDIVRHWPQVKHVILRWEGEKPESRILEEARAARYDLIKTYMRQHGISHLFTAHHQDDQAETFLIRLAKGSGLDGLAGMQKIAQQDDISLCRPLLDVSKADLIAYCEAENIAFVNDPTNENEKYLRPRLRASRAVLEEEGLSAKRLSVTAMRLARARSALESMAEELFERALKDQSADQIVLDWAMLKSAPEELTLRVLTQAIDRIHPEDDYGPRMERLEQLLARMLGDKTFNGATLGGCLFAPSAKNGTLTITKEKP